MTALTATEWLVANLTTLLSAAIAIGFGWITYPERYNWAPRGLGSAACVAFAGLMTWDPDTPNMLTIAAYVVGWGLLYCAGLATAAVYASLQRKADDTE